MGDRDLDAGSLLIAIDLVEQAGLVEQADRLRELVRAESVRRPRVLDSEGEREVFGRWPWLRETISAWAEDPMPKLAGLEIAAVIRPPGHGQSPGAVIMLRAHSRLGRPHVSTVFSLGQVTRQDPDEVRHRLDLIHLHLARLVRNDSEDRPDREADGPAPSRDDRD